MHIPSVERSLERRRAASRHNAFSVCDFVRVDRCGLPCVGKVFSCVLSVILPRLTSATTFHAEREVYRLLVARFRVKYSNGEQEGDLA